MLGAPASPPGVHADELSDARARAAQAKKDVAAQKARDRQADAPSRPASPRTSRTRRSSCTGINADLSAVKVKIATMQGKINAIKADYDALVAQVKGLDAQLVVVEAQEVAKRSQLAERKALLAERVRSAYDTDRTSLLESFLSGGTFTDLLAEMSNFIDVGEQDQALAAQITVDQETLASLHQTTEDTRTRADDLRQQTAAQKRALDKSLAALNDAKAQLKALEKRTATALAAQKRAYATIERNKAAAKKALAKAAAAQKRLQAQVSAIIRKQMQSGNIPSAYNGTLQWPMAGDVTQTFGCTGFSWEPPYGSCSHFHQGIDIVAPEGTPVHASGDGHGRLHRLELRRRRGPGLDRHHRPQPGPPDLVRPHVAAAPGRDLERQPRVGRPGHRLRGQHRATRPARTSTGRSCSTGPSSTRASSSSSPVVHPSFTRRQARHVLASSA